MVTSAFTEASGKRRVMVVFGTRPEAIKLAPIIGALRASPLFHPIVAVTAQHRGMLDQVLELFGIAPDHDLDILRDRQTLTGITTRALDGMSPLIASEQPHAVMVQGDTTTTFAGALAAFYNQVPVVHVEAGLRTFNPLSPYPEEINRRLTTQLSSLHLAPTATSRANLLREGVSPADILVTGNSVIDALLWTVQRDDPLVDPALEAVMADERPMLLVTAHRRESWGEPMASVGRALARLARLNPGLLIVLPAHANPVVRETILPLIADLDNVVITEPQPYGIFARLIDRSTIVLTDSGGVQEEAPSLGKPVLVMRDTTERPEAVEAGTARLVGTREDDIVSAVQTLLDDPIEYGQMANAVNPYGDGLASERTVAALANFFGVGDRPREFSPDYAALSSPGGGAS